MTPTTTPKSPVDTIMEALKKALRHSETAQIDSNEGDTIRELEMADLCIDEALSALSSLSTQPSQTEGLDGLAREWYAKEYHIDLDECMPGHSSLRYVSDLVAFARSLSIPRQKGEVEPASFTEVASLALDMTEAIWPRVRGIEQYELTNLAERCIYKGMELRKRHHPLTPSNSNP